MSIVSGSLFAKRCIVKRNGARSRRVYIDDPSEAPPDREVEEGSRGGLYYEMPLSLEEIVPEGKELDTWEVDAGVDGAVEMQVLQGQGFVADVEGVGRDVFDVVSVENKYANEPTEVVLEDKDGNPIDETFTLNQIDVSHRLIDALNEFGRPVNVPDIDVPEVEGSLSDDDAQQIVDDIEVTLIDADRSAGDMVEQQNQLFDSLREVHSDEAVDSAKDVADSWTMAGYTDVTEPWIAAMAMSGTDEPPAPLLTADNELHEEKLEETDEEVVSVFADIIKCSQEAIREEFGDDVEVHREFGKDVVDTYLQIDDGAVTVKPQALESWSATSTGASPHMGTTAVKATRSFSPEDFAFYGPFVLGSLAGSNKELTLMGGDVYTIPPEKADIKEELLKADVDPDRLYRLSPSASLSRGEEYFEALEEEESTEEKGRIVQKPFADFESFDECVSEHSDKDDPEAYCAQIHYEATGEWPGGKSLRKSVELMANELSDAGLSSVRAWRTGGRAGVDFTVPAPFGVEGVKNTPENCAIVVEEGVVESVKLRLPTLLSSDPSASERADTIAEECRDAVDSVFSPRFRVREGPVDPRRQMEPNSDRTGYVIHVMFEPDVRLVEYRDVTSAVESVADTFYDELSRSSLFGKSESVEKSGSVRQGFRQEFNTRFARMMEEFVRTDTFEVTEQGGIGSTFVFHLKGADRKEPPSSFFVDYPDGAEPYKTVDVEIALPAVSSDSETAVKDIVRQVTFTEAYRLKFRPSRSSNKVVPRLLFSKVRTSTLMQNVRSFGSLFEVVHSPKYPSVEEQTVIDTGDVLESNESLSSEARSVPRSEWEPVDSLEELSNGDYVVIGHGDGADVEGVARIIDADAEAQEVEMVTESFRSGEVRSLEADVDFNPYKFQYRADASSVREEGVSVPEPVTEERPVEENVQAVFDRLSLEVMELERQIEENVDFDDTEKVIGYEVVEDFEGSVDDIDIDDSEFIRLATSAALDVRSAINSVVPGDNPAGEIWSAMRGAKSSASGRDGQRADALAKATFGTSGDVYGSKTADYYDFSEAEKKAFALYAKASQIVMDELYGEEYELHRGVSSYGAATFARSFFRNPDAEEFSIKETAVANYSMSPDVADRFAHEGLRLRDDDPLVINANDILRGYYRSSAAPSESEIWLPGGDQTLSPEDIDVRKEYTSRIGGTRYKHRTLDEFVGQEPNSMSRDAVLALLPHVKQLVKHVDRGEVTISQQTAQNVLEFIERAEELDIDIDIPYEAIEERVMAEAKADVEPTIDLTTEEAVDWLAETREMEKERVRSVHDAPDDVVVRKDESGLFYRAPEGVPDDAEYIAPDESVPEGWGSMQTEYGGTYAWESSQESQEPSGLPDDVEPRPSINPMTFSLQAELDRVDGSFEEDLYDYLEEVANDTNNRHIEYYAEQAERRPDAVAVEDLPSESQESVSSVMSSVQPEQNACYRNAQLMATQSDELTYCEGVVVLESMNSPVLHAWIEVDGETVDPTFEATGQDISGEYYGTEFDDESVVRVMAEEGMSRPMAMGPPRDDEQARIESGGGF